MLAQRREVVVVEEPHAIAAARTDGAIEDSVGFGQSGPFVEGAPAPNPSAIGTSLSRVPDGQDTDANQFDFRITPLPTPGAANYVP